MTRKIRVAGNWKLNGDLDLANSMIPKVAQLLSKKSHVECMLFPSFVHLSSMLNLAKETGVQIGAQNVSEHAKGAYTGEVSLAMLKSVGINQLLLGHSERRTVFSETNELIFNKLGLAVEGGLDVTYCVGETLAERESGKTNDVIAEQLKAILATPALLPKLTIAYEPVWAIGTGVTATPEQAQMVHEFIRAKIADVAQAESQRIHILYGGSVNASNAEALFAKKDIDGGLVGGASLKVDEFLGIIECTN